MCGIAGYVVVEPSTRKVMLRRLAVQLLYSIAHRGRDAVGYAFVNAKTGAVHLAKAPVTVDQFVRLPGHMLSEQTKEFDSPRIMILHTRAATQGSPKVKGNNHPIYTKASGLCMVHNGWVMNDEELVKSHGLSPDHEVDSEVLLKLIEHFYLKGCGVPGSVGEAMKLAEGSFACAMIKAKRPDEVWLWRDSGQLSIAETDFGYVFASTEPAVVRSIFRACKVLDFSYVDVIPVEKDTLLCLKFRRREVESVKLEVPVGLTGVRGTYRRRGNGWTEVEAGGTDVECSGYGFCD